MTRQVALLTALLTALARCTTQPTAPPEQLDATVILYDTRVGWADGRTHGTRVWADGRVESVRQGPFESPTWEAAGTLRPGGVTALREALASDALIALPAQLPHDIRELSDAPRATWAVRVADDYKRVDAAAWSGIRVAPLEAVDRVIRDHLAAEPLTTSWTVPGTSPLTRSTRADLPCGPHQSRSLRAVGHALLDAQLTPRESSDAPSSARIDWKEGTARWSTELFADGAVARTAADGTSTWFQLTPDALARVNVALATADWARGAELCDAR